MKKEWIEAMRLRTLPVSIAGVLGGVGIGLSYGFFSWLPALVCLAFALCAQITSNFANEYFDFVNGLDKPGRDGFRRGLAEGDIKPSQMKRAMLLMLALDACLGLSLLTWGGIWLIAAGAIILLGALAYSGGPWPLSHHGLGDAAVIIFYGLVPVFFTAMLQANDCQVSWSASTTLFPIPAWGASLVAGTAIGMMGANVLIVNNCRDIADDRSSGKHTTAVIFGRKAMQTVYLLFWLAADLLISMITYRHAGLVFWIGMGIFAFLQIMLWRRLCLRNGKLLNALLRQTALLMLGTILLYVICAGT